MGPPRHAARLGASCRSTVPRTVCFVDKESDRGRRHFVIDDLRDQLQSALGAAYTIERELGGGGMSRVFLAREVALNRQVVVKVVPIEGGHAAVERFRREITTAAQLQHPHIVPVLSAGEAAGVPYFTMPYVPGDSLRARMAGREPMPQTPPLKDVSQFKLMGKGLQRLDIPAKVNGSAHFGIDAQIPGQQLKYVAVKAPPVPPLKPPSCMTP